MKPKNTETPYFIEALARGLEVLALFSKENPRLSLSDIVEKSGLSKATAYRILSTLEATGYLIRDGSTKRYYPSMQVLSLGFTAINNLNIRQVARSHLQELAQNQDLTTSLGILDGLWVIYIDRVRNREIFGVLLGLGDRIPAHCSSMGKVMLAHLDPDIIEARLHDAQLKPCTPRSIQTVHEFKVELEKVREQGFAINDAELYSGLRAIAAPIFNNQGDVVAAVNASGSQDTISSERLRNELPEHILQTARNISQTLKMIHP